MKHRNMKHARKNVIPPWEIKLSIVLIAIALILIIHSIIFPPMFTF